MHDAPPPPLDRQGIGRFPAGGVQRSDITLNDGLLAGVTPVTRKGNSHGEHPPNIWA